VSNFFLQIFKRIFPPPREEGGGGLFLKIYNTTIIGTRNNLFPGSEFFWVLFPDLGKINYCEKSIKKE